jgi:outer membrane receptor protein involved in Fe transport
VAGWAMTYVSSYKQVGAAGGPSSAQYYGGAAALQPYITAQGGDTIAPQAYHDVFMEYTFEELASGSWVRLLSGTTLSAGIRNLFDKAPPFDANYGSAFYSGYGDLRLRSYSVGLKRQF